MTHAHEKLEPGSTRAFMESFLGYGSLEAPMWFVGMEESGGDLDEIGLRLDTWSQRGRQPIEDVAEYHLALARTVPKLGRNFRQHKPVIQRTWLGLTIISMVVNNLPIDLQSRRAYQRDRWGRRDGKELLAELLPLPSPSTAHWHYADLKGPMPELESRERYKRELTPRRTQALQSLIAQHEPRFVVFYGSDYLATWEKISGGPFQADVDLPPMAIGFRSAARTNFFAISHPVAHGWANEHFGAIGEFMRRQENA